MFAFLTITIGFVVIISLFRNGFKYKQGIRMLSGAGAALLAVALFPLAGYVTGSPACIHPASSIPVSIVTSPLAMAISAITVPAGYYLSTQYLRIQPEIRRVLGSRLSFAMSSLFMIFCMLAIALINNS